MVGVSFLFFSATIRETEKDLKRMLRYIRSLLQVTKRKKKENKIRGL